MEKVYAIFHQTTKPIKGKASACMPDAREKLSRLSGAYGTILVEGGAYSRQALAARPENRVRSEAGAGASNLIFRQGALVIAAASF